MRRPSTRVGIRSTAVLWCWKCFASSIPLGMMSAQATPLPFAVHSSVSALMMLLSACCHCCAVVSAVLFAFFMPDGAVECLQCGIVAFPHSRCLCRECGIWHEHSMGCRRVAFCPQCCCSTRVHAICDCVHCRSRHQTSQLCRARPAQLGAIFELRCPASPRAFPALAPCQSCARFVVLDRGPQRKSVAVHPAQFN